MSVERVNLRGLYAILYSLIAALVGASLWLLLSTNLLVRPEAIHYEGDKVTLVRATPFGEVWADWSVKIRVTNSSLECFSGRTKTIYHPAENDTVEYHLQDWAKPCLQQGPPLVIIDTWQAYLFGVFPVRPVQLVTLIKLEP